MDNACRTCAKRSFIMRVSLPVAFCLLVAFLSPMVPGSVSALSAADLEADHADLVKASFKHSVPSVIPGETFELGIHLKMKPHWHTYWINPGESGEATKVKFTGPAGFEFGQVRWPLPTAMESFGAITYGYEGEVLLIVPVKVSSVVKPGTTASIEAHVNWLACNDTCVEGEAKLSLNLPIVKADQVQVAAKGDGPHHAHDDKGPVEPTFAKWNKQLPVTGHKLLKSVEQSKASASSNKGEIVATWTEDVAKVQWFPVATSAVAIENIKVNHTGQRTVITYKPTVYKAEKIPGGKVDGLLVFVDGKGHRIGVAMSFLVPVEE